MRQVPIVYRKNALFQAIISRVQRLRLRERPLSAIDRPIILFLGNRRQLPGIVTYRPGKSPEFHELDGLGFAAG